MPKTIASENEQFITQAIADGTYADRVEALDAAVNLLRSRAELIAKIDEGTRQLRDGEYTDYSDETLRERAEQIKREGRERLHAKRSSTAQ